MKQRNGGFSGRKVVQYDASVVRRTVHMALSLVVLVLASISECPVSQLLTEVHLMNITILIFIHRDKVQFLLRIDAPTPWAIKRSELIFVCNFDRIDGF